MLSKLLRRRKAGTPPLKRVRGDIVDRWKQTGDAYDGLLKVGMLFKRSKGRCLTEDEEQMVLDACRDAASELGFYIEMTALLRSEQAHELDW